MIDRACISLTSKCQLRCTYCHFDKHIEKNSCTDISPENLQIILTNIINYSEQNNISFKIGLVGAGEPLLRFDLIQEAILFTKQNDKNSRLSFYTISNGIALSEEKIKWFYENKDKIKLCISLDGSKNIQDLCRVSVNKKGSFDKVMETINLYKKYFKESPSINSTVHKQTLNNAKSELNFFEENFSEVCFSRLVDEESFELKITKSEFAEFMEKAAKTKLSLRQLRKPLKYDCTMYGQLCGVGRTNIFYADGKVYPCGRFIGNKEYELGTDTDELTVIENCMKHLKPVEDGKCYFDENVRNCW